MPINWRGYEETSDEGSERVLDGLPAHAHGVWPAIEPGLHRIENTFVLPALDPL
jgi:hypothetical protein